MDNGIRFELRLYAWCKDKWSKNAVRMDNGIRFELRLCAWCKEKGSEDGCLMTEKSCSLV